MVRGFGKKKYRQNQRKLPRLEIPFHRVSAEIRIDETKEVAESRVFLNDLSPAGVGCFVTIPIEKGTKVSMVIEQPRHLFVTGVVAWCTPYTLDTKVLTSERYTYRIGIKFSFDSEEERLAVGAYCEELYRASQEKRK